MNRLSALARRAAEQVAGPIVVRRRLPTSSGGGTLYASGRIGGLKYLLKSSSTWDPDLLRSVQIMVRTGAVVWDVGANVGLFSRAAAFHAESGGQVIAFEPDVDAIELLGRTQVACTASDAPIRIVHSAIADTIGYAQFAIARRSRAANALAGYGSTQTGGVAQIRSVPCSTLDAMLGRFEAPWILKIDVEGAEARVLQGGHKMLAEVRPWIHCEVSAENARHVSKLLTDNDYRLTDASDCATGHLREVAYGEAPYNTIAIPREQFRDYLERAKATATGAA